MHVLAHLMLEKIKILLQVSSIGYDGVQIAQEEPGIPDLGDLHDLYAPQYILPVDHCPGGQH